MCRGVVRRRVFEYVGRDPGPEALRREVELMERWRQFLHRRRHELMERFREQVGVEEGQRLSEEEEDRFEARWDWTVRRLRVQLVWDDE